MPDLSHCGKTVYAHDRDRFYVSLFIPSRGREALLALYALHVELAQIPGKISEPMIGQMRLAWWQESIEGVYAGKVPRGHPLLEALAPVTAHLPKETLMTLVEKYREHSPESPPEADAMLEEMSLYLLRALCPEAEPHWRKAHDIITRHRARYDGHRQRWLAFRLLLQSYLPV